MLLIAMGLHKSFQLTEIVFNSTLYWLNLQNKNSKTIKFRRCNFTDTNFTGTPKDQLDIKD